MLAPLLIVALALGCGLLVERLAGWSLRAELVLPVGLATMLVLGDLLSRTAPTRAAAPFALVAVAVAGALLRRPREWSPQPLAWGAAAAVYLVYCAPLIASGSPTFSGYISLDDTATWFAISDRLFDGARDLSDLAPSSYEATLAHTLAKGYPVGAFVPLALLGRLGFELSWVFQPYLGLLAAMLALALADLLGQRLPGRRGIVALGAFLAAQPALLFAYGQWGGIKELTVAVLLPTFAAVACAADRPTARAMLPAAVVVVALISVLSFGGAVWLVPAAAIALIAVARGDLRFAPVAWICAGAAAFIACAIAIWGMPEGVTRLVGETVRGNLAGALSPWQGLGVWPSGDFREELDHRLLGALLIAAVAALAAVGLWAQRHRPGALRLYCVGTAIVAIPIVAISSPWLGAKTLAIASPAALTLAVCGVAAIPARWRAVQIAAASALCFGIAWSNWLAYRDVDLAPHDRLEQLAAIGERIDGWGPTLLTEYEPYAVRHLLRRGDAEAPSELRVRPIPLRDGSPAERGTSPDTDELSVPSLLAYRAIITRRGPYASRPPAPYLLEAGYPSYDVWRRPEEPQLRVLSHLPGGGKDSAAGPIDCEGIRDAASLARESGGELVAATAPSSITVPLAEGPDQSGTLDVTVDVPRGGRFDVWIGGGARGAVTASVDGVEVGSSTPGLDRPGQLYSVGSADLEAGSHDIEIERSTSPLAPGSSGPIPPIGPLVLAREGERRLVTVDPADAESLCGRRLDWIEAVAPDRDR